VTKDLREEQQTAPRMNMQALLFIEEALLCAMMQFMSLASEWWHGRQQGTVHPELMRRLFNLANLLLELRKNATNLYYSTMALGQSLGEAQALQLASYQQRGER
jgi:hypothetical protein